MSAATWKTAQFDLQTDGMLRWKSDEPWPWDAGAIDIKQALGVWLLGPPGWRRLVASGAAVQLGGSSGR